MTSELKSILLVEERLLEARYFARQLRRAGTINIHYNLNAFLSAARSVTFLLQKEMHDVPGWMTWWADRQREMAADPAMRFFLLQRNHSQKAGRVSIMGASWSGDRRWTYRFVSGKLSVPEEIEKLNIADACLEHVAKLARISIACIESFPFHSNPRRAMTPEGVRALAINLDAIDAVLGFPHGWTRGFEPIDERIRVLRDHFDGPDECLLAKIAGSVVRKSESSQPKGNQLSDNLFDNLGKIYRRQSQK